MIMQNPHSKKVAYYHMHIVLIAAVITSVGGASGCTEAANDALSVPQGQDATPTPIPACTTQAGWKTLIYHARIFETKATPAAASQSAGSAFEFSLSAPFTLNDELLDIPACVSMPSSNEAHLAYRFSYSGYVQTPQGTNYSGEGELGDDSSHMNAEFSFVSKRGYDMYLKGALNHALTQQSVVIARPLLSDKILITQANGRLHTFSFNTINDSVTPATQTSWTLTRLEAKAGEQTDVDTGERFQQITRNFSITSSEGVTITLQAPITTTLSKQENTSIPMTCATWTSQICWPDEVPVDAYFFAPVLLYDLTYYAQRCQDGSAPCF